MDEIKSLEDYAKDVLSCIRDYFGDFQWRGSDDYNVIREWYHMGIEPHYVLLAISESNVKGNFRLREVNEIVKRWYRKECRKEASEARETLNEETLPYNRIEKLAKIVKSILIELEISDFSVVKKILSLRDYPSLKEVEKTLYSIEEEFYKLLETSSPKTEECRKKVKDLLSRYEFYWDENVLKASEKALVRNCLRKIYGIPEFSVV
jgi:hypothetical protein